MHFEHFAALDQTVPGATHTHTWTNINLSVVQKIVTTGNLIGDALLTRV